MIVDDDPAIRRLLQALLASAGYQVRIAVDGEQAIALCAEARPDAVFLDVSLPGMSGWNILAELRDTDDAPPVVLLTGDVSAVRRARQEGAAGAIVKPFDIDEVLAVATRLLGPPSTA